MTSTRLNASVCDNIDLNVRFLKCGVAADPYTLRSIKIYKCSVGEANLITQILLPDVTDDDKDLSNEYIYGGYIQRCGNQNEDEGDCGTDITPEFTPGCFIYTLNLCPELFTAGTYYDVWEFIGDECVLSSICDPSEVTGDINNDDLWSSQCNQFYVNENCWATDDGLRNLELGFEPLDSRFQQPEKRTLQVGLTPLPLYNYDSKLASFIPSMTGTITIQTAHYEIIVDAEPISIGLRSGSYRSNPYVVQYLLDTSRFLKGTYKYRIDMQLPNGETRSSPYFNLAIR
jgi:hypothetical protein